MRQIPLSSQLLVYLDDLEFTEAALSADPDAAIFAPEFATAIGSWESTFKAERTSRREVIRSEAIVAVRNVQLDRLTMSFAGRAKVEDAGFFARAFKISPSRFVAASLRKQCEQTRDVLIVELAKLGPAHVLSSFVASLQTATEAALVALDGRNAQKGKRQSSANDVEEWKEGINKLRTVTHADLVKLSVEKGFAKTWADTFFRAEDNSVEVEKVDVPVPLILTDSAVK